MMLLDNSRQTATRLRCPRPEISTWGHQPRERVPAASGSLMAEPPHILVECCWCRGSGKVVHQRLSQAISVIRSRPWTTNRVIADCLGITLQGAANLTFRLHEMGLVDRRRGSRSYEWRALPDATEIRRSTQGLADAVRVARRRR